MIISEPILTNIHISKIYGKMISILYNMGEKYWGNSSYFCSYISYDDLMMTKAPNLSNWRYKTAYLN